MYTVFNTVPRIGAVNIATIDLDYVKKVVLEEQWGRYREYRYQTPGYIESDHLLLKILNMLGTPFDGDLASYYQRVAGQVNRISGSMGLSNSAHHGRVFDKGTFYGKHISEIIVTASDRLSPGELWNNWEVMSAVRVLSHPIHGPTIIELDGTLEAPPSHRMGVNLAVLELNIPLLACQYQLWKMSNRLRSRNPDAIPDAYFISQVVLPAMLLSHLDITVLNTLSYMFGMDETFEVKTNMPFYISDLSTRYENGMAELLKRFSVQTTTFNDMLSNIPCFGARTLLHAVRMPELAFTNQVIWALTASRLHLVAFLLKLNDVNGNVKNDAIITRFRRSIIEAQSGKYLVNQVPGPVAEYFATYIQQNIQPYLKEI